MLAVNAKVCMPQNQMELDERTMRGAASVADVSLFSYVAM
jgi:hypothetical protein